MARTPIAVEQRPIIWSDHEELDHAIHYNMVSRTLEWQKRPERKMELHITLSFEQEQFGLYIY